MHSRYFAAHRALSALADIAEASQRELAPAFGDNRYEERVAVPIEQVNAHIMEPCLPSISLPHIAAMLGPHGYAPTLCSCAAANHTLIPVPFRIEAARWAHVELVLSVLRRSSHLLPHIRLERRLAAQLARTIGPHDLD